MLILITNAGCMFGFSITGFLDYFGQIKMNIMLPVLFLLLFYLFPETPEFLLKQNKKSVSRFYCNNSKHANGTRSDQMRRIRIEIKVPSRSSAQFRNFMWLFSGSEKIAEVLSWQWSCFATGRNWKVEWSWKKWPKTGWCTRKQWQSPIVFWF